MRNRPLNDVNRPAGPAYCTDRGWLCRIGTWTESEWAALPPGRRPAGAEHVPGLGWIAPVPVQPLN